MRIISTREFTKDVDNDVCLVLNKEDLKSNVKNVFFPKIFEFNLKDIELPDNVIYRQPTLKRCFTLLKVSELLPNEIFGITEIDY